MKRLLLALALLVASHSSCWAQSSATEIELGFLSTATTGSAACSGTNNPCFIPYSTINPMPTSTSGGGGGGSFAVQATTSNATIYPLMVTGTGSAVTTGLIDLASPFDYNASTGLVGILGITTTALTNNGTTTLSGTTTISGALNATATISLSGIVAGTVSGSQYLGVNSSNHVVYGSGGAAFTPVLQPMSVTTTDTAGNLFPYTYFDGTTTGASAIGAPAWGVAASLSANTLLRWRFKMPPTLPTSGTLNLCTLCQANATSGVVKYSVLDADVAVNNTQSVGATSLNTETQTSITWTNADDYVETCTPLTETPTANHVSAGALQFTTSGWTLASILACNITERWQ
jgi:hypothetical protein